MVLPSRGGVDYARDIKPLLQERCYACHGALQQKGGLRLDTVDAMRRGGKSGPALIPGRPGESLVLERVSSKDVSERMPPEHEGTPLDAAQTGTLRAWIAEGAVPPSDDLPEADPREHWAFRPPVRPSLPKAADPDWARNPVDAFIAQGHAEHDVSPLPEAPREVLVRRLYLDLIGLPPSPAELDVLSGDRAPDWYERLVDRLLEDPRHGERWARHWMDVWRYSDAWGLGDQLRNSQRHIWRWRDWIVESINADLGYDAMIRQMLAADETHPEDPGTLRATGFLARNYFLFNRNQWMEETVEHVGKGFLGLTLNCAKCHDHKYDPIPQADFYRFRAFFEPYHARIDAVPGETDPNRDGLPRAFDRDSATPTYRFIRGQESAPDTSAALAPGIPAVLGLALPAIVPVSLPVAASEPERRPWVREDALRKAAQMLAEAQRDHDRALIAAGFPPGSTGVSSNAGPAAIRSAVALQRAQAECTSLERRIRAMEAEWSEHPEAAVLRRTAVIAERAATVARAREGRTVAEIRLATTRTAATGPAADGEVAKAEEALKSAHATLDKAEQAMASTPAATDTFTRLTGARWTATRFLDSTKDDPDVPFPRTSTGRRTALAAWITDVGNPLTARVAVNQVWMRHFGAPLVPGVFEFGRKNGPPALPGLLDWLACEFMEHGWSFKHLHRILVTSSTYRMTSSLAGEVASRNLARDPDNLHLWRRLPARLESQVVRDSLLAHAGQLNPTLGGAPVPMADQSASRRRSLYFFHSNNERNAFLTAFDEAAVKECYRREQSIVPQQALALLNSRLVQESATPIATRIAAHPPALGDGPADDREFVRRAFAVLLGFEPSEPEAEAARESLRGTRSPSSAARETEDPRSARALLVWALLNHNDFVTLR